VARYEIDDVVRAAAAAFPEPDLRTLDAIHLATASAIFGSRLEAFVTYDQRLGEAAKSMHLPVVSPGRSPEKRQRRPR
jgi:predicted nucleic acid-binding protein